MTVRDLRNSNQRARARVAHWNAVGSGWSAGGSFRIRIRAPRSLERPQKRNSIQHLRSQRPTSIIEHLLAAGAPAPCRMVWYTQARSYPALLQHGCESVPSPRSLQSCRRRAAAQDASRVGSAAKKASAFSKNPSINSRLNTNTGTSPQSAGRRARRPKIR